MTAVTFPRKSLPARAKALANRLGASILLPQPGYVYSDSAGTTAATVDGTIGRVNASVGSLYASQATAGYQPRLRKGAVNLLLNSRIGANRLGAARATLSHGYANEAGALTASKITESNVSGTHEWYWVSADALVQGLSYSYVGIIKAGERTRIKITFGASITQPATPAAFDLSTGTVLSGTASITPVGNGFYRVVIPGLVANSSSNPQIYAQIGDGASYSYTGDGTSGLYVAAEYLYEGLAPSVDAETTSAPASNLVGPYLVDYDAVDDKLTIPAQASGHTGCTLIRANVGAAQTTTTGVSLASGYDWTADSAGLIVLPDAAVASATAPELALFQRYANYLGGYTA